MMWPALPLVVSAKVLVGAALVVGAAAAVGLPRQRFARAWRRLFRWTVPAFAIAALGHVAWWAGAVVDHFPTSYWGAAVASVVLILLCALAVTFPVAVALFRLALRTRALPRPSSADAVASTPTPKPAFELGRREVLQAAAIALPVASVATAASGFVAATSATEAPSRVVTYSRLPHALEGLRILQLSDMHLGAGRNVSDLEALLQRLEDARTRPDLIVLTGDIAEDVGQLPPALAMVAAMKPRLGVMAALGNHEHLRGVSHALRAYERSDVRLLLDEGAHVPVGDAELWIAGIDDPVIVHTDIRPRLRAPIERALEGSHEGAFRLLLSHRPEAFDDACARGVELTLSGHTHGGQIGFAGKSAFEPLYPDGYLWGTYRRNESRLYTTSGFGAWFPFRVGCPAEAPLLALRGDVRAPSLA